MFEGLRIPMGQDSIDSTWITFNKPKEATSHPNELVEHGGFLMALGLNGHLSKLGKLESFDYLVISHTKILKKSFKAYFEYVLRLLFFSDSWQRNDFHWTFIGNVSCKKRIHGFISN